MARFDFEQAHVLYMVSLKHLSTYIPFYLKWINRNKNNIIGGGSVENLQTETNIHLHA